VSGKLVGAFIVIVSLVAGIVMYWTQTYAYYDEVSADAAPMTMISIATGQPEPVLISGFEGIDATSSPLRFRACFTTQMSPPALTETYEIYPKPTPLTAPGWFECFDAAMIGEALERGEALAFLSARDIHDGVDRVIAVFPDGRAFAWHQLNEKYSE
jgi:hypothetical protein